MEKLNFVKNGVVRLPPGFRFHPTDEELVVQYLKRKVFSCPLPASIIPEIDVCKFDPWVLPGRPERERYFFSLRESKYQNGNRSKRATDSGYWKATGLDKEVVASKSNLVVGMKKVLVFYRGKPPKGSRTDWVMHEYRLTDAATRAWFFGQGEDAAECSIPPMGDWVLCRIFLKKRSNAVHAEARLWNKGAGVCGGARDVLFDFMNRDRSQPGDRCSSSESSVITQLSSAESPDEVTSS